jgi:hypothetical protein
MARQQPDFLSLRGRPPHVRQCIEWFLYTFYGHACQRARDLDVSRIRLVELENSNLIKISCELKYSVKILRGGHHAPYKHRPTNKDRAREVVGK